MRPLAPTLLTLAFVTGVAGAGERILTYQADLDQSQWQAAASERSCTLSHEIPNFGRAVLRRDMGRKLVLELETLRPHHGDGKALIISAPPGWRPGVNARRLGEVQIGRGRTPFRIEGTMIDQIAAALEQGMSPTLRYEDPPGVVETKVALTAIHFDEGYREFLACADSLTPTFEQVKFKVLHFDSDSTRLTEETREYLDLVIEYLNATSRVRKVLVDGHSDMRGTTKYNQRISLTRAANVELYLTNRGIDKKLIKVRAFGRSRPVASNKTEEGRSKNRRVEIEVLQ
ncbi:flagellar protein MotY [Endothiovibrio diazotrophicus]